MSRTLKISLVTGLLLAAGLSLAQPMRGDCPMGGPAAYGVPGMMQGYPGAGGRMDPAAAQARMQARMEQRHAALKAQLKITPQQEAAWKAFVDSGKPRMDAKGPWPKTADLASLPLPERLEKMKALQAEHQAAMTEHMDAHIKAARELYAALTPEQQKILDAQSMMGAGGRAGRPGGQGPRAN